MELTKTTLPEGRTREQETDDEKLFFSCRQPANKGYVLVPFASSGSKCVAAKNAKITLCENRDTSRVHSSD